MLNLWKSSNATKNLINKVLKDANGAMKLQKFRFSGGHGGHHSSGSDHDHEHDHEDHHEHEHDGKDHPMVSEGNFAEEARSRIFSKQEAFSVDDLLSTVKEPLTKSQQAKYSASDVSLFKSEGEYINFLANSFEKTAILKYPGYKQSFDEYKHLIPNLEKLNPYQKEVFSLDTYLHWQLEKQELEIREMYNFEGSVVERARQRFQFFDRLTQEDHHHDNTIMHHLKEKLRGIIKGELNYEEFKHKYNEIVENQLVHNIIEAKKKTFYYEIAENKTEVNQELDDINAPGNKHKFVSSVLAHDHIHPQHWLKNPEKANEEKWKYLAMFDIIVDQHLRQIRPSSISEVEEMYKYVKEEYKPLKHTDDDIKDNRYWEYLYTLDNEFFMKFKKEMNEWVVKNIPQEGPDDPHRPVGKLWKEQHKFPHVADRMGWQILQETPYDKNPLIERVESHPLYQFQPFVQAPSWEPDKDLSLEEGEVIYENKYVFEWVIMWRLLAVLALLPLWIYIYESYNNNTPASPEYSGRFGLIPTYNMTYRGLPRKVPEKLNYWGNDMWYWQHWIRKGLAYPVLIMAALAVRRGMKFGNEYVVKAVYNREKDLVFLWRPSTLFGKQLHVYELHYLEQTAPKVVSSWNNLGYFKKDGLILVHDLRGTDELVFYNEKKYWNVDERGHFFKNTTTFWRGLKHKDFNKGVMIDRSDALSEEELLMRQKIQGEIKMSIEKYGPMNLTDYEYNYRYQIKKRIQDIKKDLIEGKSIDTSKYKENHDMSYSPYYPDTHAKTAMH